MKTTRFLLVTVAVVFGLMTIVAGTRVLLGSDPGYVVFRPLLIFNTAMGVFYVAAGIIAWRNIKNGLNLAAAIFVLNLFVLTAIFFLSSASYSIAVDSLRAMLLRTAVWFGLFAGFWWLIRGNTSDGSNQDA